MSEKLIQENEHHQEAIEANNLIASEHHKKAAVRLGIAGGLATSLALIGVPEASDGFVTYPDKALIAVKGGLLGVTAVNIMGGVSSALTSIKAANNVTILERLKDK